MSLSYDPEIMYILIPPLGRWSFMKADRQNSSDLIINHLLSHFHVCTNESARGHKITYPSPSPRPQLHPDRPGLSHLHRGRFVKFFLSDYRLPSESFSCLAQMSLLGFTKLHIPPPGRMGLFHQTGGVSFISSWITFWVIFMFAQVSHLGSVKLHIPSPTSWEATPILLIWRQTAAKFLSPHHKSPFGSLSCLYKWNTSDLWNYVSTTFSHPLPADWACSTSIAAD